jgi:hypothetical protein
LLLWIIIFIIIILISSVLAYRSMRDYEEIPDTAVLTSIFYIRSPENLKAEVFRKIHGLLFPQKQLFSVEKLYKGKEKAFVLFGPRELIHQIPELNLIELEDYLAGEGESLMGGDSGKKVDMNQSLTWLIDPKNNPKREIHSGSGLNELAIGNDQKVFVQAVCMPENDMHFQTTWRIMVADRDSINRVALAKAAERVFGVSTGLNKSTESFPESKKFESFKMRTLIPREIAPFPMSPDEILDILTG